MYIVIKIFINLEKMLYWGFCSSRELFPIPD